MFDISRTPERSDGWAVLLLFFAGLGAVIFALVGAIVTVTHDSWSSFSVLLKMNSMNGWIFTVLLGTGAIAASTKRGPAS